MEALLRRATSNDPNPTPITIYTELAWLTHTGDDRDAMSRRMVSSLASKLASGTTELDARLKVLLTAKNVAKKGSTEFRRYLQAHKELVKDHTNFDAPPCELRGKAPHEAIRKAARDALEAMFDTTPATLASLGSAGHIPAPMSGVLPTAASRGKYGGLSSASSEAPPEGGGSQGPSGSPQSGHGSSSSSRSFPPHHHAPQPHPAGGPGRRPASLRNVPVSGDSDVYVSMDGDEEGAGDDGGNAGGPLYDENATITERVVAVLSDFISPPPPTNTGAPGILNTSLSGFIAGSIDGHTTTSYPSPAPVPAHFSAGHGQGPRYPPAYPAAYGGGPEEGTYGYGSGSGRGGSSSFSGSGSRCSVDGFYVNPDAASSGSSNGSGGGIGSTIASVFGAFASFVSTVPEPGPLAGGQGNHQHTSSSSGGSGVYGGFGSDGSSGPGAGGYVRPQVPSTSSHHYHHPSAPAYQPAQPPPSHSGSYGPPAASTGGGSSGSGYGGGGGGAQAPGRPGHSSGAQVNPQALPRTNSGVGFQPQQIQPDLLHMPQPQLLQFPLQLQPQGHHQRLQQPGGHYYAPPLQLQPGLQQLGAQQQMQPPPPHAGGPR